MVSLVLARVPANWEHPVEIKDHPIWGKDHPHVIQMRPMPFDVALAAWEEREASWKAGTHPDLQGAGIDHSSTSYEDWEGRPEDPRGYAPWAAQDATWYQLWQDSGEGSPVSPPFETIGELIDHLVNFGDDYEVNGLGVVYGYSGDPWTRDEAEAFMAKHAPAEEPAPPAPHP